MTIRDRRLAGLGPAALAAALLAAPSARAATGAEVLQMLNHDGDDTLEIAEVIHASSQLFAEINPDGDTTLERPETKGRLTEADWKRINKDGDETLEMDEWLAVTRVRFEAADANHDGRLTAKELDGKAGRSLVEMIVR